jgi:cobalamin biosynthesis protein CbiG
MKIPEAIESISLEMALRENKLKNVAMRIIIDIRDRKRKPKLRDFIQKYKEKLAHTDDKRGAKEEF